MVNALVLAAGYGTRLSRDIASDTSGAFAHLVRMVVCPHCQYFLTSLVFDKVGVPKPLLPIGGVPLISRWVDQLAMCPLVQGVFVVSNEVYKPLFDAWATAYSHVHIVSDGTLTNETRLGAVACLQFAIDTFDLGHSDLLVIGGDTLYFADFSLTDVLSAFEHNHGGEGASMCLVYPTDDKGTTKHGIVEVDPQSSQVTAFLEKPGPTATASRLASPCTYLFSPAATALMPSFLAAYADGPLEARDAPGNFLKFVVGRVPLVAAPISGRFDVGSLDTYVECDAYFRALPATPPRRHMVGVLVGPCYHGALADIDPLLETLLVTHADTITLVGSHAVLAGSTHVDALLTLAHPPVTAGMLAMQPRLRLVSNYGVGLDHVDLVACKSRAIAVGHTPHILSHATADMAWALLLSCARRIVEGDAFARGPAFITYQNMVLLGKDVHGATLGIVGMGRIGAEVARRSLGFKMRVLYHNRTARPDVEAELGATLVALPDLLEQSDYVVLVCPQTPATRHLIDAKALRRMKPTATLINIARGGVVDTDALVDALRAGVIHSAGLDVFDPEPLPRDHPLHSLPNVTLAPHRGSATAGARRGMALLTVENLLNGLRGAPLVHEFQLSA